MTDKQIVKIVNNFKKLRASKKECRKQLEAILNMLRCANWTLGMLIGRDIRDSGGLEDAIDFLQETFGLGVTTDATNLSDWLYYCDQDKKFK